MRTAKKLIKEWSIPLAFGLLIIFLFQFVLMVGYVPSASMKPAIPTDSYILGLRIHGELLRGDIVIFRLNGRNLVKRIAAVPGDIVYICESTSTVKVNDAFDGTAITIEVPDGCFYMLGDNLSESIDSRYWVHPFVHETDILAKLPKNWISSAQGKY